MKKKIFDKYANAIASEFHLSIEEVFEKIKTIRYNYCETDVILLMF